MTTTGDGSNAPTAANVRARLLRTTMQILADAGQPLSAPEVFDRLRASGQLSSDQLDATPDGKEIRFEREVYFGLISEVKAGWLNRPPKAWQVTDSGRDALQRYPDALDFHREADRLYTQWKQSPQHVPRQPRHSAEPLHRDSINEARSVLEALYSDEAVQSMCIRRLGESARIAEDTRPGSWSITLFPDVIRLNVGRIAILALKRGEIEFTLADEALDADDRRVISEVGEIKAFHSTTIPEAVYVQFAAEALPGVEDQLAGAHRRVIEVAIARAPRTYFARTHSPGVTALLREETGIDLADPPSAVSTTRTGGPVYPPLEQALAAFDRQSARAGADAAEHERERVEAMFPRDGWPTLPLERYALGTGNADSFCRVMEFGSPLLGSIRGGSALKHIIFQRSSGAWHFDAQYGDLDTAWQAVRAGFVEAFRLAELKDYGSIDAIPSLRSGAALRTKALFVYFPDDFLPIFSSAHLAHFISLLGSSSAQRDAVAANRLLWELMRARGEFAGWTSYEMERFLYSWADPRQTQRVVKIAPGPGADQWVACRDGGYICVGWDEVGDLSEYASKEDFESRFAEVYRDEYKGHKPTLTLKAREVWTLRELQPGDTIIANRGGGAVVGTGTVVEPAYNWRPDRAKYKHTVAVHWDDTTERVLDPPVATWRTSTVAAVTPELYQRIMAAGQGPHANVGEAARQPVAPPQAFLAIAEDLDRRGQVILHGPPGTGKTYAARRFSVWWLLRSNDAPEAGWILGDDAALASAERQLSDVTGTDCAQLTRVTFHPSYSYEDFVEGFKPRPTEGRGGLELELRDGAFKAVCRAAMDDPDSQYLLLIDEINRGNIPKIFGELITLLEKDKRGLSVRLPYSGEPFVVPPNVFVIGTMNTADRSIRLLDAALRRRFSFLEVPPEPELLAGATVGNLPLDTFLLGLNQRIAQLIGVEKQIGHSFFLGSDGSPIATADEFFPRFTREVLPLLQEYAYEDMAVLESLLGHNLVDAGRKVLITATLNDPDALAEALAEEYGTGVLE